MQNDAREITEVKEVGLALTENEHAIGEADVYLLRRGDTVDPIGCVNLLHNLKTELRDEEEVRVRFVAEDRKAEKGGMDVTQVHWFRLLL